MKLKSFLAALTVVACSLAGFADIVPFKDVFPFKFGTCINGRHLYSLKPEVERVIAGSFNTVTPENELKPESVQPREGVWRFDAGDRYVAFAEKHGMKPIGHCLVWHQQTGRWMFRDEKGGPATRERLIARMKTHIQTVVGRYKGRIKGWDVVNEVFGGDGRLHRSPWLDIVGPDFIELAFTFAHEADPACELYYNDYNMDNPRKRAGVVKMIRDFKKKGIRIDGVGMQSHHRLRSPNLKDYEDSIAAFAAEGVKVMITELDISVLPAAWGLSAEVTSSQDYAAKYDPYRSGLPDAKQKELSDRYVELFKIYLRHAKEIDRVTFWGFCDRDSWLNNFPVRGRTDYPLLYDRALKPKPCAQAIFDLAKGTRAAHGGEVVLFDAASADPSTVHAQDGATFKLANGLLTVTTAPSDRYPGFTVSGNWDLSACGEIEVEFVNGGIWGQYTVRLLNQDGVPAGKGCYIAKMPVKNEKHKLASQPIPPVLPEWSAVVSQLTRVRTWALPYLVWDTDRADVSVWHTGGVKIATLDPAHVAELAVYINTPKLPHTWSVRRIVAKGTPRAVQVPAFAKLPPEKFFPCIDAYGQFIHREWPDKVHSDADFAVQRAKEERDLAAHPGPDGWDKWGGWAAGPQLEATGGFRTTKWNGKWWIVDPDGHLWWSHGPVRVTPSCATTALDGHENWFARLPAKDEPEAAFYSTRDQATSGRFDGENMQVGWTDVCDTPYWETIAGIRKIGYSLYSVRGSTSNR